MMKLTVFTLMITLLGAMGLSKQAQASLVTIGTANYSLDAGLDYNLIYDDAIGRVWLDYTSPFFFSSWDTEMNWAAGLNNTGVLTYNLNPGVSLSWIGDWRLPTSFNYDGSALPVCEGYGCTGSEPPPCAGIDCNRSEMGHLYYSALGNSAAGGLINTGDFHHLNSETYWSSTRNLSGGNEAWTFSFSVGSQSVDQSDIEFFSSLAVRSADVSVPEPSALLLLGSGLAGLGFVRRRFKA